MPRYSAFPFSRFSANRFANFFLEKPNRPSFSLTNPVSGVPIPKIRLKAGRMERVRRGHPWVFSNELVEVPQDITPGTLVNLVTNDRDYGLGFYNPNSLISVRLLGLRGEALPEDFFHQRIQKAQALRNQIASGETCYRLVFGESDQLPGLVIDRFDSVFSIQILSWGMELNRSKIHAALLSLFPDTIAIVEKDSHLREREGLPQVQPVWFGQLPDFFDVRMDGLPFRLRLGAAQKTGFFLDQKSNQRQIGRWSKGLRVLDCFCNQGGFSLQAARGGAVEVLGLDSSEEAVSCAAENAVLFSKEHPSLRTPRFQVVDVFDFLNEAKTRREKWDFVIVDPPAFAKNKKSAIPALKAYARLNEVALSVLSDEAILATGSCSMHVEEERFFQTVEQAAFKTGKKLSWLARGGQNPDHPILSVMSETRYLKWGVFRVQPLGY